MYVPRKRNTRRMARKGPRRGYRTYRRSIIRRRQRPQNYKGVVSFKRTVQLSNLNVLTTSQNLVYNFSLNALPNATEFINLYDAFKIKCVVLKFVPTFTGNDLNAPATAYTQLPLHSVIDTSDAGALSLLTDYLQYNSYKMTRGLAMHTRKVYPKFLDTVDDAGTPVSAGISSGWLKTEGSGPDVDHLGVKVFCPANSLLVNNVYQVFATYYIQCKNTK